MVQHLGIIMDGNRRFSKRIAKEPWKGHEWGQEKLKDVLRWARKAGISELTLYAFSMQNFNRPKKEFDHLMKLFISGCDEMLKNQQESAEAVCVRFIGDIKRFPKKVCARMEELQEYTKNNVDFVLNLCMAYGGREEIVLGVKKIAQRVLQEELLPEDISMDTVSESLQLRSEPDVIIRTGGDHRTSNFLVWQSWYSEWFFVDSLWPEFSEKEFFACLEEFSKRKRRFGR